AGPAHLHHIHPVARLKLRLPRKIQRGETQLASQTLPRHYDSFARISVAQQRISRLDLPRLQVTANARAADRLPVVVDAWRAQHRQTMTPRLRVEQRYITASSVPKPPVFAHVNGREPRQPFTQVR